MYNIALVGNPNCGKTTLFNSLTGSDARVGNWPGVTVEKKYGIYKNKDVKFNIIDLPGTYSLSPYTLEEQITNNFILDDKPDCIINVVDATNLERNLYLTTQLIELDIPIVVALNLTDIIEKTNKKINEKEIEKFLNVPVISVSALTKKNLPELMNLAYKTINKKYIEHTIITDKELLHLINDIKIILRHNNINNTLFHSIKLIEQDISETAMHKDNLPIIKSFKQYIYAKYNDIDFSSVIANNRYDEISKRMNKFLINLNLNNTNDYIDNKIDKIILNKFLCIPILLLTLFLMFHITFSENFLFTKKIIQYFQFKNDWLFKSHENDKYYTLLSPGCLMRNIIDKIGKIIKDALFKTNASIFASFFEKTIIESLLAIISSLPQILLLYLIFSILEDTGYMSRIVFMLDNILCKFKLSGRSFLPLILGTGCYVPAMSNTRTILNDNERKAVIKSIPFIPCNAKLPIITTIISEILHICNISLYHDIIIFMIYISLIIISIIYAYILRSTTLTGELSPLIMELPNYRKPIIKNLMHLIVVKAKQFIKKAFTVILLSNIVIWFMCHFSFSLKYQSNIDDYVNSIIYKIAEFISPIFIPLGFTNSKLIIASLSGLIAKENILTTLYTISQNKSFIPLFTDKEHPKGNIHLLIVFLFFNLITIPCVATLHTCKCELQSYKETAISIISWLCVSYVLSVLLRLILIYHMYKNIFVIIMCIMIIVCYILIKLYKQYKNKKQCI